MEDQVQSTFKDHPTLEPVYGDSEFELIRKMSKDTRNSARLMGRMEAKHLVRTYYQMQDNRIRAAGQVRAIENAGTGEPHEVISWFAQSTDTLESQIGRALLAYSEAQPLGEWMLGIVGIGGVLSAGLLSHIDFNALKTQIVGSGKSAKRVPVEPQERLVTTAGDIWSFAGYNPNMVWEKGQKRPFNADLKVLCYKIGESFVKFQSHPKDIYGKLYAERKALEWERNLTGLFHGQTLVALSRLKREDSWTHGWLSGKISPTWVRAKMALGKGLGESLLTEKFGDEMPMLSPGHIHARARRVAVKMFLSHVFEVGYFFAHGERPSLPYVISQLGHVHYLPPPNSPFPPLSAVASE